ncbi:MAG: hypothetical protein ACF8QF_04620 [Phycisphaerales bacterium]
MIDPASTVPPPTDPAVVRGVVHATGDDFVVLRIPGSDYRIRLVVEQALTTPVGEKVEGRIRVQARRMDTISAGGRYVEPVEGRPRRVQGRIIAVEEKDRSVVVSAGVPIACRLHDLQEPGDFQVDQMVTMDVLPGASFTPAG